MAVLSTAVGAHAGLRDKIKSAVGKKSAAAHPCKEGQDVPFDDTTVELTGDVLDNLLACRKAAQPMIQEIAALMARRVAIQKEMDDLRGKHQGAIDDSENRRAEVRNCMSMALETIEKQKVEAEMANMMANPRSAEKLLKLTAALNDAQMKGDTAAVSRLQREMSGLYDATHADTLAAEKQCGRMPAPHPAAAKIDALGRDLAALDEKMRDLEKKTMKTQVDRCKMTEERIAMAWERVTLYLEKSSRGMDPCGFSATELAALSERKDALAAALEV